MHELISILTSFEWHEFEFGLISFRFFLNRWGRWEEILHHSGLRKGYTVDSIQDAFRLVVLYCVNTYRGDEKLKTFAWELITPPEHANAQPSTKLVQPAAPKNSGTRSSKRSKKGDSDSLERNGSSEVAENIEWVADEKYDMEQHLDKNYR